MILESTLIFLLVYWSQLSECSGYNRNGQLYHQQQQQYQLPAQHYRQPAIKNRYHPTTYSKESSEEQTPAANMPKPQAIPQIQYAYQGGESPQDSPDYPDLNVHQGEVLNHVRQPGPQSVITPRPHPVYQQMAKPSGGSSMPEQPPQPPPPQMSSQGIPQQAMSSPIYRPQEIEYDQHQGYSDDQGYPAQLEFDGYHYSYPVHPPPPKRPPPQKSKATESQYAYYYIGRHLWYIPLYFSIYFIAYVGLLVLKSIARHKVLLPHLSEDAAMQRQYRENYALRSIAEGKQKYYMRR